MKTLYIIKAGTTFQAILRHLGDFDRWTADALGPVDIELRVVDAENGEPLPNPDGCAGVVITGSHAMVTDNLAWSVRVADWLGSLVEAQVPVFGICYGHQLLAHAAGGQVDYLPNGREIGTVRIELLSTCSNDPIFHGLPESFSAQVSHSQTVVTLPDRAVRLAASEDEPNHAFRVGECAWGVQFHPEFTLGIMQSYINLQTDELESAGLDVRSLLHGVSDTPVPVQTLRRFARVVKERLA